MEGTQLINRFELAVKWNGLQLGPGPNHRIQMGCTFSVKFIMHTQTSPILIYMLFSKIFAVVGV